MQKLPLILLATLLSACSLVPDYLRPGVDAGTAWKDAPAATEAYLPVDWWKEYNSANVNQMVPDALLKNNDLIASLQRIEQARAAVKVSNSSFFPQISASGSQSKNWRETNGSVSSTSPGNVGFSISYEADLFGRARAGVTAAEANLQASRYDYEALRIVTATSVVQAYAQVLTSTERLRVAQGNLDIAKDVLKIVDARFQAGSVSALELSQQKSAVSSAEASMASLKSDHESFLNQLAVLLAFSPQNFWLTEEPFAALVAPYITPNLPSQLLERRPDIRSAEANLIAANANIGAARAAFLPSLNLAASGVLNGNPASSVLGLTASVLAPIFTGGELEGELDSARARKEELVATYRQTVLTAFQEVGDALAAVRAAETRVSSLTASAQESRRAYELARKRYDAGSTDFQTLLDTQRTLLQAEDSATQARLEQITASLNLIKALGGGWRDAVWF